jgi:exodeoxyribonuclease VII small subunit
MEMSRPEWSSDSMTRKDAAASTPSSISDELARLEEIVRRLEAEDLELDAALALFEEGVTRLRAARERLAAAELKVQSVLEEASGDLRFTKLDA